MNITEGEWKVETSVFGDMFIIAGDEHKHSLIADINVCNDDCEANCNLIAAAPDMAKLLQDIINSDDSIPIYMSDSISEVLFKAGVK